MIKWTVDFLHFFLQKWLTREDIAGAIKPTKLIGISTEIGMKIEPLDDSYENYRIDVQTQARQDWDALTASSPGRVENGVLKFSIKHHDGSVIDFRCYLESENSMEGDWSISAFGGLADAIKGTLSAAKIGPPPAAGNPR